MQRLMYGFAGVAAVFIVLSMLHCVSPGSNVVDRERCEGTDNGYFDIYSPEYEQSLMMGSQDSIKWSNLAFTSDLFVSLFLYKGEEFVQTIKTNAKNSGICLWTIPRLQSGDGYRIKVANTEDTTQFDFSCSFSLFSNYSGGFTIVRPEAGFACTSGTSFQIQWESIDNPGDSVSLELCRDTTPLMAITPAIGNSGAFSWAAPKTLVTKNNYRIKIASCFDRGINALSAPFTIVGPGMDGYEPDNVRDSASLLDPLGKAQLHSLTVNDIDWVKFGADSGKAYAVEVKGDARGYLYSGGDTTNFIMYVINDTVSWICPKTGAYYFQFSSFADSIQNYSVNVTRNDSLKAVVFLAPSDSTVWIGGQACQIKWIPDSAVLGDYADISLFKGSELVAPIISNTANGGVYNWTIPSGIISGSDYRIQIGNHLKTSVGHYSGTFTIKGLEQDDYEPDNKRDSASTLSPLGNAQSHTLTMNDTDWVRFSADSGEIYIVQASGNVSMGVYLYRGSENSYATYFSTTSRRAASTWTCTKTGSWFARIAALSSLDGTPYLFNVTKFDSLKSVSITAPAQGTTWSTDSSYRIQWKPDSAFLGTSVRIYLLKGSNQLITIAGNIDNSGSYSWRIPAGLTTGSDYRIKIVNYSNSNLFGLSSFFTISGITPDSYEPDNKRDSASTLSPLGKAQSHTLTMNDTDWVKFSADSGRNYIIQCNGDISTRMYLYYGSETNYSAVYISSASSANSRQWTCLRSGAWYSRITSYPGGTGGGSYSFNVSAFDSLTALSFTSPTAASAWTTGQSYTIQWTPDSAILGTNVRLQLYKGGSYLLEIDNAPNSGSFSWTVPAGLLTGSDYRIKVANGSNVAFGGYSPLFSITGLTPDSYEPDDSVSKASAIATDGAVQNRSLALGDIDWIRFTAIKDSLYILTAETSGSGAPGYTIKESLYDSLGISSLAFKEGTSAIIKWVCPQNGTYHLAIQSSSGYYGDYTVSIKTYSPGVGVNFINPTALSIWTAGSSYSIEWTPDTALFGQYVRLQLNIDTTMVQVIRSSTQNAGIYSWTPPSGMASGSSYVIKLSSYDLPMLYGYSQAFTISGVNPDAFERDDSAAIAHTIAATGTPESHTLSLNDQDWFNFSATENYIYTIKTTGAASSMSTRLYLYNTDGRTLIDWARSTTSDSSAALTMFCQTSGTYYFRVTSTTTGDYQAMVSAYDSTQYGLNITKPAAGDSLALGQADTVKWSSQVSIGGNVDIYLCDSSGVVQSVATNRANDGSCRWTVPATVAAGSDYYLRITSRANSRIFGVSGVFTIKGN